MHDPHDQTECGVACEKGPCELGFRYSVEGKEKPKESVADAEVFPPNWVSEGFWTVIALTSGVQVQKRERGNESEGSEYTT